VPTSKGGEGEGRGRGEGTEREGRGRAPPFVIPGYVPGHNHRFDDGARANKTSSAKGQL